MPRSFVAAIGVLVAFAAFFCAASDPLPFERAPMALAGRSVHLPLAADFHIAFDTELLRIHTAWQGGGLTPPAPGRWLASPTGVAQWGNPPVLPWRVTDLIGKRVVDVSFRHRFTGLSAKGGVTLLYELAPRESQLIRIHESPRLDRVDGATVFIRRFEISAAEESLEYLAHSEPGRIVDLPKNSAATILQREKDFLLLAARGRPVLSWQTSMAPAGYTIERLADDQPEPQLTAVPVTREEARAHLVIPPHGGDIAFEICTVICPSREAAEKLVPKLVPVRVQPVQMEFITSSEKDTNTPPPAIIAAGNFTALPAKSGDAVTRERLVLPKEIASPVSGMDFLPNGELAFCTRGGEVWIASTNTGPVALRRFARGLREPSGLRVVGGQIYVAQQCELTRLVDTDGNGEADLFECVSQSWGFVGHPDHVVSGPALGANDRLVIALGGRRGLWDVSFMGWAVRSATNGLDFEGFARGLRAPGGVTSLGATRDILATDNRGAWAGAAKIVHLRDEAAFGFPSASPAPEDEFKEPKQFDPPAVWLPHTLVKSAAGIVALDGESFGAWKRQLLVADPANSVVLRVALEKVSGEWQGAVWPLLEGVNARCLAINSNGVICAAGGKELVIERFAFNEKAPFEVREIHATAEGFELVFTQPVDAASAGRTGSFAVEQFSYAQDANEEPQMVGHFGAAGRATPLLVTRATVSEDRLRVRLAVENPRQGFVTTIRAAGVTGAEGSRLRHDTAHYTLNQMPK